MLYAHLHNKIILSLLLISALGCKSRNYDSSALSNSVNSCTTSKDRLNCPFQLGVTHNTGGQCVQRFLTRIFKNTFDSPNGIGQGYGLWNHRDNVLLEGTGQLKKIGLRLHLGRHKEIYDVQQNRWISTMEPYRYHRKDREPENVVLEWDLDTMGAPNNIRTLMTLVRLGYFQSGDFSQQMAGVIGQTGAAWSNAEELKERFYYDPVEFYGSFKKAVSYASPEFQAQLANIQGRPDYPRRLMELLNLSLFSEDKDICNRSKWLLDEQFAALVEKDAERNPKYIYLNDQNNPKDAFEELAARMLFRQFHFDFYHEVPFVGSEVGRDPFYTFSENTYWSYQMQGNQFSGNSEPTDVSGNPHDFYFGDLIFFNNSSNEETYDRFIQASPTKLAINPFLAMSSNRNKVLASNDLWQQKTSLPPPAVIGRFINRESGYNKLVSFITDARKLAEQRSLAYRQLDQKAKTFIHMFAMEITGADKRLEELDRQIQNETDEKKRASLHNEMTKVTAEATLELDAVRRIVDATRVAFWNFGARLTSNNQDEDIFAKIIAADSRSEIERAKSKAPPGNTAALLEAFLHEIRSQREANTLPVEDIRVMRLEIIPYGTMEVNEENLYQVIPGKGTYSPKMQQRIEEQGP